MKQNINEMFLFYVSELWTMNRCKSIAYVKLRLVSILKQLVSKNKEPAVRKQRLLKKRRQLDIMKVNGNIPQWTRNKKLDKGYRLFEA